MLGTSIYILLPTADEIIIHPTIGLFFAYTLNVPYIYGVIASVTIYRLSGLGCILAAFVVGGKPAFQVLKEKWIKSAKGSQR